MGILDREGQSSMNITGQKGQTLDILVENQGRIGFAFGMNFNSKVPILLIMTTVSVNMELGVIYCGSLHLQQHVKEGTFSTNS